MRAPRAITVRETRSPALPMPAESPVRQGFVLHVVRKEARNADRAVPIRVPRLLPTSREAIRAMRAEIRGAHVFGMTPREVERAVAWADSGWMTALGLLNSGAPCGYTVALGDGADAEWSLHPVRYLGLTSSSPCPGVEAESRPEMSPWGS